MEVKPLPSSDHFSVEGPLLRAWASQSSLERIDGIDADPYRSLAARDSEPLLLGARRGPREIAATCFLQPDPLPHQRR